MAPRSPDIDAFATNLDAADSWLTPFHGFGASNFLAGDPAFRFADYREWIAARFPPRRFAQLEQKMDWPSLYAIGAFIQGLRQNPGLEATLHELGLQAHVYVGTGLGNIAKLYDASIELHHAQRRWDRFWSEPERNRPSPGHVYVLKISTVDRNVHEPASGADRRTRSDVFSGKTAARADRSETGSNLNPTEPFPDILVRRYGPATRIVA